jgi:hypothetical protein
VACDLKNKISSGEEIIMKKRILIVSLACILAFAGYLVLTALDSNSSVATASKKTYTGTMYVAGMGGHFAKIDVTLDPNSADAPIKMNGNMKRVSVGSPKTHPVHDARIDNKDRNIMYYSTYVPDASAGGKVHLGKIDLRSNEVIKDVAVDIDPRGAKKAPAYCASGQSDKYYMPIFMGSEGYVDVIDKATMERKHRLYVSDLGYKPGTYKFTHGTNSPDMKKFLIIINEAEAGKGTGHVDLMLVDLPSMEEGKWKVLAKNSITGEPDMVLAFREYFSADGKYIFQSGADRMWVLNASNLKIVDEKRIPDGGQVHDVLPTPDGKYALMTVRMLAVAPGAETKEATDGFLMAYDFDAKKLIGKPVSTCMACHRTLDVAQKKSAILCGIDGNWKM